MGSCRRRETERVVPHAEFFELRECVCEAAEWHERVRDEAQGPQLARSDGEERLDGVGAEDYWVEFLAELGVARKVPQGVRDVAGVEARLKGDVVDAGAAVLGLDAHGDEEDKEAVGIFEGQGGEANVEGLLAEEAAGECNGPACGTTVCASECNDFLPDLRGDTFEPALCQVHRLGVGKEDEHWDEVIREGRLTTLCAARRRLDCKAAGRRLEDTRLRATEAYTGQYSLLGKGEGRPIAVMDSIRRVEVCSPAAKRCYRDGQEVRSLETSICKSFRTRVGFASIYVHYGGRRVLYVSRE